MKYQLNSKTLFLTYPQNPTSKDDALLWLHSKFSTNLQDYIIASELHANGDPHLHLYVRLVEPFRTTDPKALDMFSYHGNYQGCRSTKNVIKYCTKAEDYLSNLDVNSLLDGKSTRSADFADIISKKKTLVELVTEKPQYLMGYKKLKLDYEQYLADLPDGRLSLPAFLPNPWNLLLSSKVNGKKRHFWIYSDKPDLGKTYKFAKPLAETYRAVIRTGDEPYWNLRGDEDIVILDEYNHAIYKFFVLNSMCDGTYPYRIFQGGNFSLRDPLIIVLSNTCIQSIYPYKYELLHARFNEYKLD